MSQTGAWEPRMEETLFRETHWEKAAKTRMGKYLTKMETEFIFSSIDSAHIDAVMDVGAEAGRFSFFRIAADAVTIGIDINSYGLKRLKLKTKQANVIQADARKIPLKDEVFDAVFMIEVLDYIPEVEETLRECRRTMKSNASLVLSFGNSSSLKSNFRKLRGKAYRHSYGMVMRFLSKTGFAVKRKMGYSWLPLGRTSENPLIPFLAAIEKLFALRRLPSLSPWVILHAEKSERPDPL